MKLEHPALKENEYSLRVNISLGRKEFITKIIAANEEGYLDLEYLSEALQDYEEMAQQAVQGNLQLKDADKNITEAFPVQSEKWTILQAIFFASTICTTIGKDKCCMLTMKFLTFFNYSRLWQYCPRNIRGINLRYLKKQLKHYYNYFQH